MSTIVGLIYDTVKAHERGIELKALVSEVRAKCNVAQSTVKFYLTRLRLHQFVVRYLRADGARMFRVSETRTFAIDAYRAAELHVKAARLALRDGPAYDPRTEVQVATTKGNIVVARIPKPRAPSLETRAVLFRYHLEKEIAEAGLDWVRQQFEQVVASHVAQAVKEA